MYILYNTYLGAPMAPQVGVKGVLYVHMYLYVHVHISMIQLISYTFIGPKSGEGITRPGMERTFALLTNSKLFDCKKASLYRVPFLAGVKVNHIHISKLPSSVSLTRTCAWGPHFKSSGRLSDHAWVRKGGQRGLSMK